MSSQLRSEGISRSRALVQVSAGAGGAEKQVPQEKLDLELHAAARANDLGALQKLAVRDRPCDAKEIVSLVGTAHNSVDTSIPLPNWRVNSNQDSKAPL